VNHREPIAIGPEPEHRDHRDSPAIRQHEAPVEGLGGRRGVGKVVGPYRRPHSLRRHLEIIRPPRSRAMSGVRKIPEQSVETGSVDPHQRFPVEPILKRRVDERDRALDDLTTPRLGCQVAQEVRRLPRQHELVPFPGVPAFGGESLPDSRKPLLGDLSEYEIEGSWPVAHPSVARARNGSSAVTNASGAST